MVPVVLIRRGRILRKLEKAGAISPQTALALEEAGVAKGDRRYPGLLAMMVREGDIVPVGEKFYLSGKRR